eukprot:CAMPEP_0204265692 /NCGR_PEP_ID=MMETSP0468-20130131/9849_1 /ASSEMBLY_ACC=CAM_ASM_000383 /TAXON_ID=2969 /ORGANISM="Oxyrrhis marina" /LENGTH=83 /DNA_ID=CAMNT_0051240673 /DNA_START=128 /DNA_END=375 /DNA_ORIENTATION=+
MRIVAGVRHPRASSCQLECSLVWHATGLPQFDKTSAPLPRGASSFDLLWQGSATAWTPTPCGTPSAVVLQPKLFAAGKALRWP